MSLNVTYRNNVNTSAPDGYTWSDMMSYGSYGDYVEIIDIPSDWVDTVHSHWGDNYSFKEWNTARDGSGTTYHIGDKVYESITLYPIWNGETLSPSTMEIAKGTTRYYFNVLTAFERNKISNALTQSSVREYYTKDFSEWPEWVSGNSYEVGDCVKTTHTIISTVTKGWVCLVANSSAEFDTDEWELVSMFPAQGEIDVLYVEISTNTSYYWNGTEYVSVGGKYAVFTGATSSTNGDSGLVPAPASGDQNKLLAGDGTWKAPVGDFTGASSSVAGANGLVPAPAAGDQGKVLFGNATWKAPYANSDIVNIVYPVGSIYMSVSSTSPATLFGGTWAALEGRFLIGANSTYTAGSTGGAASVSYTPAGSNSGGSVSSHTLTSDQIPSHNHTFTGSAVTSGGISVGHTHTTTTGNPSANHSHSGPSHTHTGPSHTHTGPAHEHTGPKHQHSWGKYKLGTAHEGTGNAFKVDMDLAGAGTYSTSEAGGGWTGTSGTGNTGSSGTGATGSAGTGSTGTVSAWHTHTGTSGQPSAGHTHSVTASGSIGNAGGGKGHSHGFTNPTFTGTAATIATMPPYLSVYMWKRTA